MFPGQPHGRFSVSADGELRIRDVRKDDEGVYVCSALSVAGSSIAKADVSIKVNYCSALSVDGSSIAKADVSIKKILQCSICYWRLHCQS